MSSPCAVNILLLWLTAAFHTSFFMTNLKSSQDRESPCLKHHMVSKHSQTSTPTLTKLLVLLNDILHWLISFSGIPSSDIAKYRQSLIGLSNSALLTIKILRGFRFSKYRMVNEWRLSSLALNNSMGRPSWSAARFFLTRWTATPTSSWLGGKLSMPSFSLVTKISLSLSCNIVVGCRFHVHSIDYESRIRFSFSYLLEDSLGLKPFIRPLTLLKNCRHFSSSLH